jgi:hypothetical protein
MRTIKVATAYDQARAQVKEVLAEADLTLDSNATPEQVRFALLNMTTRVREMLRASREPGEAGFL